MTEKVESFSVTVQPRGHIQHDKLFRRTVCANTNSLMNSQLNESNNSLGPLKFQHFWLKNKEKTGQCTNKRCANCHTSLKNTCRSLNNDNIVLTLIPYFIH